MGTQCGLLLHAGVISVVQLAQIPTHRVYQQVLRLQVATLQRRDLYPAIQFSKAVESTSANFCDC